nr:MAG TPA: hypothetical protein [Crassvirales sp.]
MIRSAHFITHKWGTPKTCLRSLANQKANRSLSKVRSDD